MKATSITLPLFLAIVTFSGLAGPARADLCGDCRGKMLIMSVGTCSQCGNHTSSGAKNLCPTCSRKLNKCEVCGKALTARPIKTPDDKPDRADADTPTRPNPGDTPQAAPAKDTETCAQALPHVQAGALRLPKPGIYQADGWSYAHTLPDTDPLRSTAGLSFAGQPVPAPNKIGQWYYTPWGRMYWHGHPRTLTGLHGWYPHAPAEAGKMLPAPALLQELARKSLRIMLLTPTDEKNDARGKLPADVAKRVAVYETGPLAVECDGSGIRSDRWTALAYRSPTEPFVAVKIDEDESNPQTIVVRLQGQPDRYINQTIRLSPAGQTRVIQLRKGSGKDSELLGILIACLPEIAEMVKSVKPAPLDASAKPGLYCHGRWSYVLTAHPLSRHGDLYYDGLAVPDPIGACYQTPWGKLHNHGQPRRMIPWMGWAPTSHRWARPLPEPSKMLARSLEDMVAVVVRRSDAKPSPADALPRTLTEALNQVQLDGKPVGHVVPVTGIDKISAPNSVIMWFGPDGKPVGRFALAIESTIQAITVTARALGEDKPISTVKLSPPYGTRAMMLDDHHVLIVQIQGEHYAKENRAYRRRRALLANPKAFMADLTYHGPLAEKFPTALLYHKSMLNTRRGLGNRIGLDDEQVAGVVSFLDNPLWLGEADEGPYKADPKTPGPCYVLQITGPGPKTWSLRLPWDTNTVFMVKALAKWLGNDQAGPLKKIDQTLEPLVRYSAGQVPSSKPIQLPFQGVRGQVVKLTGNHMPTVGVGGGGRGQRKPLANTPVWVLKGRCKPVSLIRTVRSKAVARVLTSKDGSYAVALPAGRYTVVAEIDGKLYLNSYNGESQWSSIEVTEDGWVDWKIEDTREAAF